MKYFSGAKQICCRGMTVDCLACTKGQTIEEYCEDEENNEMEGCAGGEFAIII